MKNQYLSLFSLLISTGLMAMDMNMKKDPNNNSNSMVFENSLSHHPAKFGYSSSLKMLKLNAKKIPTELDQKIKQWVEETTDLLELIVPEPKNYQVASLDDLTELSKKIKELIEKKGYANLSKNNYTFEINSSMVAKISSHGSRLANRLSSLGYDPYEQNLDETTRKSRIQEALSADIPTHQHTSHVATQLLLEELDSPLVKATPTCLYHLPTKNGDRIEDANYIVIQQKLLGYTPFCGLSLEEKGNFLKQIPLEELYRAITFANLWNVSEDNMWVNAETGEIAFPDGEKPNNEGVGDKAKWKIAIFGQDFNKYKHNIRNPWDGGHRGFENILKEHAPELVDAWNNLYDTDLRFK